MALEARNISFSYPGVGRSVLSGISLRLEPGERVGLTAPGSGTIRLHGRPLSAYRGYCPVQMIWQHPEQAVNPRMRMRDVLAEGGALDPGILEGVGIEPAWLSRFPQELSGGELQRFCIARALGPRTEFLLADEISTMLDLCTQSQLWTFLSDEVARRGIGLLAVSHSPGLLARICTRQLEINV